MEIELQENYTFEEYRILFHSILDQKKLNKTSERFNILREIYDIEGHFTVETLYRKLKEKKYQVSKTTIYNTLDLLVDIKLIIKHQFGENCAQYEKYDMKNVHDHIVLKETGEINEFNNEALNNIIKEIEEKYGLKVYYRSFTLYGDKKNKT